jgi:hypothetical protein
MVKMAKATVNEHTRSLANGTQVTVHEHSRAFTPGADMDERRSPVEQHRRARLKAQAQLRREAALERGKAAASRSVPALKKTGRQSWKIAKRGGKRLQRAARYASRRRRAMAAACVVGGVAELGASLAWGTAGTVWAGLSILGATLAGGLLLGGSKKAREPQKATSPLKPPQKPKSAGQGKPPSSGKKRSPSPAKGPAYSDGGSWSPGASLLEGKPVFRNGRGERT